MHPRALDERSAAARKKLESAATRISERLGIDGLEAIEPRDTRDPAIYAMRQLEVTASLMDRAARALAPKADTEQDTPAPNDEAPAKRSRAKS